MLAGDTSILSFSFPSLLLFPPSHVLTLVDVAPLSQTQPGKIMTQQLYSGKVEFSIQNESITIAEMLHLVN